MKARTEGPPRVDWRSCELPDLAVILGSFFWGKQASGRFSKGSGISKAHQPNCISPLTVLRRRVCVPGQWTFVSHLTLAVRARTVESDRPEIGFWPRTSYFLGSVLKVDLNYPCFLSEAMEAWKGYSMAQDTHSERERETGCQRMLAWPQSARGLTPLRL